MSIDYARHRPHPTKYRGVQFRSRLEARWAAFFDLADITWTYEPMDLGRWSPDFLIGIGERRHLVEVKPVADVDHEVLAKIRANAPRDEGYGHHLLLGLAPQPHVIPTARGNVTYYTIGWFPWGNSGADWETFNEPQLPESAWHRIDALWSAACNIVQWKAPK